MQASIYSRNDHDFTRTMIKTSHLQGTNIYALTSIFWRHTLSLSLSLSYLCTHSLTHTFARARTHAYTHTHTLAQTHTYTLAQTHTYTSTKKKKKVPHTSVQPVESITGCQFCCHTLALIVTHNYSLSHNHSLSITIIDWYNQ